jgi:hypothetical protein
VTVHEQITLFLRPFDLKLAQLTSFLPFKINNSTKKSSSESDGQSAVKTFLTVHGTRKKLYHVKKSQSLDPP